jgi:hypothetical protein
MTRPRPVTHDGTPGSATIPRHGRRCGIATVVLVIVAVGVAGCGEGSASKKTTAAVAITKAEFVAKANAICGVADPALSAAQLALASHPNAATVAAAVKHTYVPSIEAQIKGIRALGTPPGDEVPVQRMLALVQRDLNRIKSNPTLITTNVFGDFAKVAHPYGLTACAPLS